MWSRCRSRQRTVANVKSPAASGPAPTDVPNLMGETAWPGIVLGCAIVIKDEDARQKDAPNSYERKAIAKERKYEEPGNAAVVLVTWSIAEARKSGANVVEKKLRRLRRILCPVWSSFIGGREKWNRAREVIKKKK